MSGNLKDLFDNYMKAEEIKIKRIKELVDQVHKQEQKSKNSRFKNFVDKIYKNLK